MGSIDIANAAVMMSVEMQDQTHHGLALVGVNVLTTTVNSRGADAVTNRGRTLLAAEASLGEVGVTTANPLVTDEGHASDVMKMPAV